MIHTADWMTGEVVSVPNRYRDTSHFQESNQLCDAPTCCPLIIRGSLFEVELARA